MSDATPTRPRIRRPIPLVLYFVAPLCVLTFAYLVDVIFGAKFLMLPGSNRGVERFAVVTSVFCAIELVVAAFLLGRRRRLGQFGAVAVFLFAIIFLAMLFGTFQA